MVTRQQTVKTRKLIGGAFEREMNESKNPFSLLLFVVCVYVVPPWLLAIEKEKRDGVGQSCIKHPTDQQKEPPSPPPPPLGLNSLPS